MRLLIRSLLAATLLTAASLPGATHSTTRAQGAWAGEPTYRYAGRYEGDWTADVWLEQPEPRTTPGRVFEQRAGEMAGTLALDVTCDGTITARVHAQTRTPATFAALVDEDEGPRVLSATVDVVFDGSLDGALAAHSAGGVAGVQAAIAGTLRDLPGDLETSAEAQGVERWYEATGVSRWELAEGQPGRIAGDAEASLQLVGRDAVREPRFGLGVSGRWIAARTAIALCPWRAAVVVRGAIGNEQLHDEQVEVNFRPTGDGRLEGEGRGQALIRGGPPGGCEYSGGGPFSVQVVGEARDGRFRLRLEDYEQVQLLITTTCGGGRFVGPQPALSTMFGFVDLPEAIGAHAHLDLPPALPEAQGSLDVTIEPVAGGAPP